MDAGNYGPGQPGPQSIGTEAFRTADTASASPLALNIGQWEAAGFGGEVLPAMPPDAIVANKLAPRRGKIPGRYIGGDGWVGFRGWSRHTVTAEDRAEWRAWPGAGLCIRTATLPVFDIDVEDPDLADRIAKLVLDRLGHGAVVRTRDGSPRVAILFRSDSPVKRKRCEFTLPGDDRVHAVDLLGVGQQLVVAGRHPSGFDYRLASPGLDGRTAQDIPCISAAEVADLLSGITELAVAAGGAIVRPRETSPCRQAGPDARLDPYNALMRALCSRRNEWATYLFNCDAETPDKEWRLSSAELGRDGVLEEDLCLYPHSIRDFGTERSHTPVSLVCEFGHVETGGEITFGGSPEYGPKGEQPYAVIGESIPTVRRPTEAEAFSWLVRCLDGPPVPPDASRDIALACLAAAVGLDWMALNVEHVRHFFSQLDVVGNPLPEAAPETWSLTQAAEHITRVTAKRALDPAGYRGWQDAWGLSDDDDSLTLAFELEEARARGWTPPAPPSLAVVQLLTVAEAPVSPRMPNFRIYTAAPAAESIPLRQHVIYPRCPIGDVLCTVAMPGTSKSTLGIHDGVAIASGEERILRGENNVSPERLHRPGAVLIYDAEDPLAEMERRLAATMRFHNLATLRHPLALLSGVGSAPLWVARRSRETSALIEAEGATLLRKLILDLDAVYVVVGPLAGLAEGMDENAAADSNTVMQILANIAAGTGACINVIHHTSKSGGAEAGDMNAVRGSSAIAAKARAVVTLNSMPEAEAQRYGLTARNHVVLTYAKVSHGPRPEGGIIFRRDSAPVGNGLGFGDDPREAFELSAQDMLQVEGDHAPVLSVVALRTIEPRQAAREQRRIGVEDGTATAVLDVLGGVGRRPLTDILSELTAALHERRAMRGAASNTVREHLRNHLAGPGRPATYEGKNVRVRVEKDGPKRTDPWFVVVEMTSEQLDQRL